MPSSSIIVYFASLIIQLVRKMSAERYVFNYIPMFTIWEAVAALLQTRHKLFERRVMVVSTYLKE